MYDTVSVRPRQSCGDPRGDSERTIDRERPGADECSQGVAPHHLHDDEGDPAFFSDVVNGGDVGMVEGGRQLRLLVEARAPVGIGRDLRR